MKKNWIKTYQLPAPEYLWVILRLFRDEYAVSLYSSQENDYYNTISCGQDKDKAEQLYQDKITYYCSIVEPKLVEVLYLVWLSGFCNMADITAVVEILENSGYSRSASYIQENKENYPDFLEELTDYIRENQPPSLAQQLAQEMGWEVIVD